MTTMDFSATLAALRRLRVETESLACLGCGHEHNCSTHGCAILRNTVEYMEAALENYDNLSALVDRLETELKSEILSAAELRYRLANEWVSVEERLPEESDGMVLLTNGKIVISGYRNQLFGLDGEQGVFAPSIKRGGGYMQVTYWMLLPAPPDRRPPEGEA